MTNMNKLNKLKKKHNLFLIEDCAESLGSFFQSKHSGNFSDVATFSFYGSKTITTGEGGMVCSNNKKIIDKITKLKLQGIASSNRSYWHDVIGYNYKMTNILCNSQFFHQRFGGVTRYSSSLIEKMIDNRNNNYYLEIPSLIENLDINNSYDLEVAQFLSKKLRI